jgi:flagellar biogenesis protein FliO
MGYLIVIAVVVVVALVVRRLVRGRRSPQFDQSCLEEANYRRIGQETTNNGVRYGGRM